MNSEEYALKLASIRKFSKEVTSTPEKARAILVEIGVLDKEGKITENYKDQSSAPQPSKPDSGLPRHRKKAA